MTDEGGTMKPMSFYSSRVTCNTLLRQVNEINKGSIGLVLETDYIQRNTDPPELAHTVTVYRIVRNGQELTPLMSARHLSRWLDGFGTGVLNTE